MLVLTSGGLTSCGRTSTLSDVIDIVEEIDETRFTQGLHYVDFSLRIHFLPKQDQPIFTFTRFLQEIGKILEIQIVVRK